MRARHNDQGAVTGERHAGASYQSARECDGYARCVRPVFVAGPRRGRVISRNKA